MMHPATELRLVDPRIGQGVFATERIPKGTVVWVRDDFDIVFTPERAAAFEEPYRSILDKYSYLDGRNEVLLCWDHGRYVNHSCAANCLSAGWADFEVAVRDILPGEQVTDDYGTLNVEGGFDCLCGAARCRKRVLEDDLLRLSEEWDRIVLPAIRLMGEVPQPLWNVLRPRADVERALRGEIAIPSIRENYRARLGRVSG